MYKELPSTIANSQISIVQQTLCSIWENAFEDNFDYNRFDLINYKTWKHSNNEYKFWAWR